jgi:hypothetical protein
MTMLTCPMCKKSLRGLERQCPTCRADLSLLVEYVGGLESGLLRAEAHTRAGELGEAVWSYLEVLEVDPDNPTARQQVGQVVRAVRQFDREAPGRRWLARLQRRARFRTWLDNWGRGASGWWLVAAAGFLAVILALSVGYGLGYWAAQRDQAAAPIKK